LAFFEQLGISDLRLVINTLGDSETRVSYRQALIEYLTPFEEQLSADSKRRLHENPLRVLDSKDKKDKEIVANAPQILDYLTAESKTHFETVIAMLDALGIVYEVDSNMVRGLDYYTHTIFEIMHDSDALGTQSTICAGGRYDNLIEEFGGESTPGFGFGIGIERVLLTLDSEGIELPAIDTIDAYVVHLGEETNVEALKLVQAIRNAGFSADRDYMGRKAKAQFKAADKAKARLVVTIGDSELAEQQVKIKNMATRVEATYPLAKIYDEFATVYDEMITKGE